MPAVLTRQREAGTPFAFNFVDLAVKNRLAFITINRPEAMNALNEAVVNQIGQRFEAAQNDHRVQAVVFQGAGKAFVAGADIRYFLSKISRPAASTISWVLPAADTTCC